MCYWPAKPSLGKDFLQKKIRPKIPPKNHMFDQLLELLLMAEIRRTSWGTGSLSHYLQGFSTIQTVVGNGISAINGMTPLSQKTDHLGVSKNKGTQKSMVKIMVPNPIF